MARAFTINFPYNGTLYTAVITQIEGSTTIYIPDETLHSILPQGRISFDPGKGLQIDTPKLKPAQDLVITIFSALEARHREVEAGKKEQQ